ncbi:hypothetical protein BK004_03085 [bacterium CG10_46_32]|nr:MAG: hypothetical protein BK004_03085 [bacterium CG10_46_32]PIR55985.1 MAG: hypothetical protein COU73_03120 [Parcubacteria group bacterium CG10_big_fil_rev_8_21_14_0_10_46_32]
MTASPTALLPKPAMSEVFLLKHVQVDSVLKPHGTLQAELETIPGWDDLWNIRLTLTMQGGGEQKWVLGFTPVVPWEENKPYEANLTRMVITEEMRPRQAAELWAQAITRLANQLQLNVDPSYDIGLAAVFALNHPWYTKYPNTSERRIPLDQLQAWFDYTGI